MNKFSRTLVVLLAVTCLLSVFAVFAFAESTPEYKYKVVAPNGEETFYNDIKLGAAVTAAESGSTIVLLDDILQPFVSEDESAAADIGMKLVGGKTINFDFAGHTLISEQKMTLFVAEDDGTVFNIYSSKSGTKVFLGRLGSANKGGGLLRASYGSTINFGTYGEYDGKNISTYTANGCTVFEDSVINIKGVSMYRMMNDWIGFLFLRASNTTLNIEDARIIGVYRGIELAFGNNVLVSNANFTAKNTLFANLEVEGSEGGDIFIRYISDGSNAIFESCVFDNMKFTCNGYTAYDPEKHTAANPEDHPRASVVLDATCAFSDKPADIDYDSRVYKFPTFSFSQNPDAPNHINVNRFTNEPVEYNQFRAIGGHDYTMRTYNKPVGARYMFTTSGYETKATEVTWVFGTSFSTEWWAIGDMPVPDENTIPADTDYIKYKVNGEPVSEINNFFEVTVERKYSIIYNLTAKENLAVNVYIPKFEGMPLKNLLKNVVIGKNTFTAKNITDLNNVVNIGGKEYYKISTEYAWSEVPERVRVDFNIYGAKTDVIFTESHTIVLIDEIDKAISANGANANSMRGVVYTIANAYLKEDKLVPASYLDYINKKLQPAG